MECSSYNTQEHQTKLTNVTDGTTQEMGSSEYNGRGVNLSQTRSFGSTRIKITTDTTYKIEHHCAAAVATYGLGTNGGTSEPNIYTEVIVTDLAIVGGTGTAAKTNIYGTAKAWASVAADGSLDSSHNIKQVTSGLNYNDVEFSTPMPNENYVIVIGAFNGTYASSSSYYDKTVNGFKYFTADTQNNVNTTNTEGNSFTVFDETPAEVALTTFGDVINYSGPSAWGDVAFDGSLSGGMNCTTAVSSDGFGVDVTFITPMPNADYAITGAAGDRSSTSSAISYSTVTPNGFRVNVRNQAGTAALSAFSFAVFATNALPPKGGTGTDSWGTVEYRTDNGPCNVPASFNVASVTRTGQGIYDVVFTTPMPTANYAVSGATNANSSASAFFYDKTTLGFSAGLWYNAQNIAQDNDFGFSVNCTNATLPQSFTEDQIQSVVDLAQSGATTLVLVLGARLMLMEHLPVDLTVLLQRYQPVSIR